MQHDINPEEKNEESTVNPAIKFNKDYSALTARADSHGDDDEDEDDDDDEAVEADGTPLLDEEDLEENDLDEEDAEEIEWETVNEASRFAF